MPGAPPPSTPLKSLDWRGFCKKGPQDLDCKEFRGQNLDNKELTVLAVVSSYTASALTMMCLFSFDRKVKRHTMCR